MTARVTVVCVLWNSRELLPELAGTVEALARVCRVILADNGSTDGTADEARRLVSGAEIMETGRNGGFGWGNNRALEMVGSPFTLLLNSDASIGTGSLEVLTESLSSDPGLAAVQPVLRSWEWPLLCAGEGVSMTRYGEGYDLRFLHFDPAGPGGRPITVPGVTAAVSLWRTEALRRAGGFDESIFMYFEDVDLCMRLGARGWRFAVVPEVRALHRSGASSTRTAASAWELTSSAYLTRKFFGGGSRTLPRYWRRRELRTRLSCIRRGTPWTWRLAAVGKGRRLPCVPVELPGELVSMMDSRPLDLPGPRPGPSRPLDPGGRLLTGPGFLQVEGPPVFRGCGCISVADGTRFALTLSTPGRSRSGAVLDAGGQVLQRFDTGPGKPVRVEASGTTSVYVSLDERDAVAEVHEVNAGETA
jgi:GT2 family glycosyltransferase